MRFPVGEFSGKLQTGGKTGAKAAIGGGAEELQARKRRRGWDHEPERRASAPAASRECLNVGDF